MRIVTTAPGDVVLIGRRGENNACQVQIDVSGWAELYGEGHFELLHQRPGETTPYPVVIDTDGETICWMVTDTDTARSGRDGIAELSYYVGDTLAKSAFIYTRILEALDVPTEEPSSPGLNWYLLMCQALQGKVSVNQGTEHGGKLLYVDKDGNVALLQLGSGLKIVDGVLTLDGTVTPDDGDDEPEVKPQLAAPTIYLYDEDATTGDITPAILGKAILGKTILGKVTVGPKLEAPEIYIDTLQLATPNIELVEV